MHRLMTILERKPGNLRARGYGRMLILVGIAGLLLQPACLFKKRAPAAPPTIPAPVRIVMLPVNAPADSADLRLAGLSATVQMMETALTAPDLEPVPLWESLPAALQSLGTSRTITDDIAEFTTTRLAARWGVKGDFLTAGNVTTLRLDFIPSKPTLVPFRYEKQAAAGDLQARIAESYVQFLRYLVLRPMPANSVQPLEGARLLEIARALDSEYGWFVAPKPGSSGKVVEDLAGSHINLARMLFNPALYPILGKQAEAREPLP